MLASMTYNGRSSGAGVAVGLAVGVAVSTGASVGPKVKVGNGATAPGGVCVQMVDGSGVTVTTSGRTAALHELRKRRMKKEVKRKKGEARREKERPGRGMGQLYEK